VTDLLNEPGLYAEASSHNARLSAVTSAFVQVSAFLYLSCEQALERR
jgi:hypothetical protein